MKVWINKTTEIEPIHGFEDAIRFDILNEGPKSNIKVNFEELWRRFKKDNLEPIYEDLIIVATSVYAADKRIPRAGIYAGEVEDNWTREICMSIPVLEIERWNSIKSGIENILGFLSGDLWEINFRKTDLRFRNIKSKKKYDIVGQDFDAVCLFSGGLESYSGAINLLEQEKHVCFVGCREYNALGNRIYELYRILKENYPNQNIDMDFVKNERFSNPDTGKTTDLKAVLLSLHYYLKYGSKDYYTNKLVALGGMNMKEIDEYVKVYMKSMEELYEFVKTQAQLNGDDLLTFIEGAIDE